MKRLILVLAMMAFSPASHAICTIDKAAGLFGIHMGGALPGGLGEFSATGSLLLRNDGTLNTNYFWSFGGGVARAFANGDFIVRDNCTVSGSWFENDGTNYFVFDAVIVENGNTMYITFQRGFGQNAANQTGSGIATKRNFEDQRN